ncbi:response regulator transcription factor [Fulvivirga sp. RKSG066]|uniref:response regulator transcription factor n=1 Tax=Fulvivirga aurantia TaxID=2529383 RepID=UPI0012BBA4E5|nr:response regulator transcription factor [Fulvivirga aurantia]MTI21144.1 response regulator transcription factor [Fulvivirga aurantia]
MSKIRVLLVDDHQLLRDGLAAMLSNIEHITVVGSAGSGEEAVNMAQEKVPDVILMDIMMGGMTGIEATRWIKEQNANIKVIIISQEVNQGLIGEGIKSGIEGYLPKDVDKTTLVNAINKVNAGEKFFSESITKIIFDSYYQQETGEQKSKAKNKDLTKREMEVLKEVATGKTNQEVADTLFISIKTVETHKSHILDKLGLKNTAELVKYAIKNEIIEL